MRDRRTQRIATIAGAIGLTLVGVAGSAQKPEAPPPPGTGLEVLWEQPVSFSGATHVAAGASSVFVVSAETGLSAFSPVDGRSLWSSSLTSALRPSVTGGQVAVVSNGSLHVLNLSNESQTPAWTADVGPTASAIFALHDRFGAVIAQEIRVWSPGGTSHWHTALPGMPVTKVASNSDALFVGVDDPSAGPALVALDKTTGAIRWQLPLKSRPESLTATDDRLFFGGADAALYSVLTTGATSDDWRFPLLGAIGDPVADDRQVYFALRDNSVRAFERGGGSLRWDRPLVHRPLTGPMRIGSNLAIALADGAVVELLTKDGSVIAPKTTVTRPSVRLQAAALSPDATRVFTLTIAPSTLQKLSAWGHPPAKR